jgi:hypothetical protein
LIFSRLDGWLENCDLPFLGPLCREDKTSTRTNLFPVLRLNFINERRRLTQVIQYCVKVQCMYIYTDCTYYPEFKIQSYCTIVVTLFYVDLSQFKARIFFFFSVTTLKREKGSSLRTFIAFLPSHREYLKSCFDKVNLIFITGIIKRNTEREKRVSMSKKTFLLFFFFFLFIVEIYRRKANLLQLQDCFTCQKRISSINSCPIEE